MSPRDEQRILLISANREPFPSPVFPVGAAYMANALQTAGARVRIFDMRYHSRITALRQEITAFRPHRIGISLRNIDNAAYPAVRFYLPSYAELVQQVRKVCDAPVILGGSAFSLFPRDVAVRLNADGGIIGEGEAAAAFHGLVDGQIAEAAPADMGRVAIPKNIGELFPAFRRYRTLGIQTARGCPNACIYCTYPSLEGRVRRQRTAERVCDEIAGLYTDFGVDNYFIVDSLFNADEGHMARVLERLARLGLPIRFSCYLQPRTSDPGIFGLLRKAGCVAVDFGTDSGSPAMLASLRKPFTRDDIASASLACRRAGIDFCHSLVFGGPGETPETIRETVTLMDEIAPRAVIAMTGIRIYPGTTMEQIAEEEGFLAGVQSLLEPLFYFPAMGPQRLVRTVYETAAGRRNWFFPGRKDWSSTIGYRILNMLYQRGPLWKTFRR